MLAVFQGKRRHALARLDVAAWLLHRRPGTTEWLVSLTSTAAFCLAEAGTLGLPSGLEIERVSPPTVTIQLVPHRRR